MRCLDEVHQPFTRRSAVLNCCVRTWICWYRSTRRATSSFHSPVPPCNCIRMLDSGGYTKWFPHQCRPHNSSPAAWASRRTLLHQSLAGKYFWPSSWWWPVRSAAHLCMESCPCRIYVLSIPQPKTVFSNAVIWRKILNKTLPPFVHTELLFSSPTIPWYIDALLSRDPLLASLPDALWYAGHSRTRRERLPPTLAGQRKDVMTYILDRYKTTVKKNITLRRNSKGMLTSRAVKA